MCYITLSNKLSIICFLFFFSLCSLDLDTTGYNIVTEIRLTDRGSEQIQYKGFKFSKKTINPGNIIWQCSKYKSQKSKATISTKIINGTVMMKPNAKEHNHELD